MLVTSGDTVPLITLLPLVAEKLPNATVIASVEAGKRLPRVADVIAPDRVAKTLRSSAVTLRPSLTANHRSNKNHAYRVAPAASSGPT